MMLRLGITGGIGSGKSYVSHLLQRELQIPVYDCDSRAKQLSASEDIQRALQALVGSTEKEDIARYLFASAENAQRINAIIHPAVRADFRQWASEQNSEVVALESAILYESGFDTEVDNVILVDAPKDVRLQRAMQRDGATREQIESRMRRQDDTLARQQAWLTIENNGLTDTEIIQIIKDKLLCLKRF